MIAPTPKKTHQLEGDATLEIHLNSDHFDGCLRDRHLLKGPNLNSVLGDIRIPADQFCINITRHSSLSDQPMQHQVSASQLYNSDLVYSLRYFSRCLILYFRRSPSHGSQSTPLSMLDTRPSLPPLHFYFRSRVINRYAGGWRSCVEPDPLHRVNPRLVLNGWMR